MSKSRPTYIVLNGDMNDIIGDGGWRTGMQCTFPTIEDAKENLEMAVDINDYELENDGAFICQVVPIISASEHTIKYENVGEEKETLRESTQSKKLVNGRHPSGKTASALAYEFREKHGISHGMRKECLQYLINEGYAPSTAANVTSEMFWGLGG